MTIPMLILSALTVQGTHFEVVAQVAREEAEQALRAAEAAWQLSREALGLLPDPDWKERPTVHLYAGQDAFADVDRKLTGGRFRDKRAFADVQAREAHVALQPAVGAEVLEKVGLPFQTLRLIAHESSHLAVYPLTERHLPRWLAEGAAVWAEYQAMKRLGAIEGDWNDPWAGRYVVLAKQAMREGAMPTLQMIWTGRDEPLAFQARYAIWFLLFTFLSDRYPDLWRETLRDLHGEPWAAEDPSRFYRRAREVFRPRVRLRELNYELVRWIASLSPRWYEEGRSLEVAGGEWVQLAFPDQEALAWHYRPLPDGPLRLRGSLELLEPQSRAGLLFGRPGEAYFSVGFGDGGRVRLLSLDPGEGASWATAAEAEAVWEGDRALRYDILLEEGRVTVRVNGELAIEREVDWRGSSRFWGLRASPGSRAIWTPVRASLQ